MRHIAHLTLAGSLLLTAGASTALESSSPTARCKGIADNALRLECYDHLDDVAASDPGIAPPQLGIPEAAPAPEPASRKASSYLTKHWELDEENKRGVFSARTHETNYVLFANRTNAPNNVPFYGPRKGKLVQTQADFTDTELQYQLSFKTKLIESATPLNIDLWAGYTQQGNWQAYNRALSYPLRDVTHRPEVMLVMPVDFNLLGMRARFAGLGLMHESNGRSARTSRSWNRVYGQFGIERGDLSVVTRVWQRLPDRIQGDGNPRIEDYYGHGDMTVTYFRNGHQFSLSGRHNFNTDKGSVQADWAFPLATNLKGYVQAFSGYGQTLIDYNHRQTTFGVGALLAY